MDDQNFRWFCVDCGRRYAKIMSPTASGKAPCGCTMNLQRIGKPRDEITSDIIDVILKRK